MNPEEKAKELIKKYDELLPCEGTTTGQTPIDCALVCVEEILKTLNPMALNEEMTIINNPQIKFWNKVKEELNK